MTTRRDFIRQSSIAAGGMLLGSMYSCSGQRTKLEGGIGGPNSKIGHLLRDGIPSAPKEILKEDIVIVGGGIAGLSAARWLKRAGQSFRLLELESEAGGNSRSGKNATTAYPLGAHYLPLPNLHNKTLLSFLEECGVITGYKNQLPLYNEYYLCHDPKERLFINHHWQEGLIPNEGVPSHDREEIRRFIELMEMYRNKRGADGKMAFDIPAKESSQDPSFLALDLSSMDLFLKSRNFNSEYLRWYVNYCCADDFGSSLENTSAWAGIHYFASRRGHSENSKFDDVLTWPEGNHWLAKKLGTGISPEIKCQAAVTAIRINNNKVEVDYLDISENTSKRIEAKAVIISSPQFVNKYLLKASRPIDYAAFNYAPWMVANLTVDSALQDKRGEPLCWDNVIYGSKSLGYVHATHQSVAMPQDKTVLTYYQPITDHDCRAARNDAQGKTWDKWADAIFRDLSPAHPNLKETTSQLDVYLWGHGMIRPEPEFVWGEARKAANSPIDNKIFFAHSDLCGLSLFEEAFESGIAAARNLLNIIG
ncbi:amino oxidase [Cytophagales bacterium WSM2-2]|nr:amino oxidase [Cytophagales bacterium WSM2-2]